MGIAPGRSTFLQDNSRRAMANALGSQPLTSNIRGSDSWEPTLRPFSYLPLRIFFNRESGRISDQQAVLGGLEHDFWVFLPSKSRRWNLEYEIGRTPNFSTNIIPTNLAWLKPSGKSPMGLGIPPLKIKIALEANPLKSIMLVGRFPVLWYDNIKIFQYYVIIVL